MNRYSPIWSQVVDSSLWSEPDYVVKVFITMIAKKDMDDIVRGNAYNIAQWSRKTESEVLDALKILSSPDTKRIEPQEFDGRRIERVSDGWLVLNGSKYRMMMSLATRREYKRVKQQEYRDAANPKIPKPRKRNTGEDGKPASGAYKARESAAVKALENGNERKFEEIAAS